MQLTVKTLKGGKFVVNAEPTNTILEVKGLIEQTNSELPAANMKLIYSGKVLKDTDTVAGCNIKPNDFFVVMITKAKKAAAVPVTPKPVAQMPKKEETKAVTAAPTKAPATAPNETPVTATTTTTTTIASPEATTSSEEEEFPTEVISNLTGMGFPEAEVKACLRAAQGNPDVAVEFLTNGIPPAVQNLQQQQQSAAAGGGSSYPQTLQGLRNHPQFNALRRLVQTNPQTLQSVLTQIGQQQPELLREININQAAFLEMMNEPVEDDAPAPSSSTTSSSSSAVAPPAPAADSNMTAGGNPAGMLSGMSNPAQMAQMLQNMSPQELQSMATMMGLTPEQLTATAQMISQMPPDQFQEYMNMVQSGGMPGMEGLGPGGGGGGGGPQVIRLNEEEMAAVDRLTEMGFDHSEAAQAYLACDKNEALAANLLMDGGFGFSDDMGNDRGGGNHGGNSGENDDDMYD